jgi:8-oxo-dGTP diphosphatase
VVASVTGGRVIRAGGGVLWRRSGGGVEIAVVHRPKYDDWSMPKGKLHAGEAPLLAACREVMEETGVRPVVGPRLPRQEYQLGPDRKVVHYWEMTPAHGRAGPADPAGPALPAGPGDSAGPAGPAGPAVRPAASDPAGSEAAGDDDLAGSNPASDDPAGAGGPGPAGESVHAGAVATSVGQVPEVDVVRWLPPTEAAAWLSYDRDRELLRAFLARPRADALVLLVRHGQAGERSSWPVDDRLRPLDELGRAQADALRVLAWFGPHRVFSADRVRCLQTARPLADDLGVAVETVPALTEDAYLASPEQGLGWVRGIARGRLRVALCSQRDVIPDLVNRLAAEDGLALGKVSARKGSVWALSLMDGLLVAADYYPDLTGSEAAKAGG